MDQTDLQAHISKGLAKAASIIGTGLTHYRPLTAMDPLLPGSAIGTVACAFDVSASFKFASPTPVDHPFVLLLADPGLVQGGDYLTGTDTYFVSRIEPLQPAWCVLCNMTVDILDTAQSSAPGANSYGGVTSANNSLVARGWPVSMLAKTRGEQDVTKLPTDTRSAFFEVLMPSIPDVALGLGLCLRDLNMQIYIVMSSQTTAYGCRLIVGLATT